MSIPKHAAGCHGRAYPSKCPTCHGKVFYFACSCGNKVFYQSLGGEWPVHACKVKKAKALVTYVACEKCFENIKEYLYAVHLEACVPIPEPVETALAPTGSTPPMKRRPPRSMTTCPHCNAQVGARRMKVHLSRCPVYLKTETGGT